MNLTKKQQAELATAYRCALEISILNMKAPLRYINQYIAENISGFGTAADEKVRSRKEYRKMIMDGRRQSKGMIFKAKKLSPYRPRFTDETTVSFHDEVIVEIGDKKQKHSLHFWFTTVFKYSNKKWQMILFHGSMPDAGSSSADTFHVGEAEKKLKELEKIVTERTLELQIKNRELEIEAALERIRAQTLAMHNSEDVGMCIVKMFAELTALGVDEGTRFGIGILNQDNDNNQLWTARKYGKEVKMHIGNLDMTLHPLLKSARKAWKEQVPLHKYVLKGKDLVNYYRMLNRAPDYSIRIDMEKLPKKEFHYGFVFEHGLFYAFSIHEFQTDLIRIAQRFSALFEQTYRRYLDLVKAEAQVKEAQIEAALERVRSRSLAMHKSNELKEVIRLVLSEIRKLDVLAEHAGFYIDYKMHDDMHIWLADPNIEPFFAILPYFDTPTWNSFRKAKATGTTLHTDLLDFKEKNKFYKSLFKLFTIPEEAKQFYLQCKGLAVSTVLLDNVGLYIENFSGIPYTDDENKVLMRFGKVFQQAYTRFLDLQKAETQAREAQIEVALERVRAQAMAMHRTEDLGKTIQVYYDQLDGLLDVDIVRCGAGLLSRENTTAVISTASKNPNGETYSGLGSIEMNGHPMLLETYTHWLRQQEYHGVLRGNDIKAYYQYLANQIVIPENKKEDALHFYFPMFSEGSIYMVTTHKVLENELKIFRRFSSAISLAYKRFNDLRKAEANAEEAVRRASLDRIRAEIASMRTKQDLDRITPLIWNELTVLGVPFVRCGVFIMEEAQGLIHTFLSTPDGKAIASFHLPYATPSRIRAILHKWQNHDNYMEHWDTTAFEEFVERMQESGIPISKEKYMSTIPQTGIHLHCMYFLQGMLYVGNTAPLKEEDIQLIHSVAEAFSTAYARYEDFNKLEAAKQQVEIALTDVKQAQQQLVQSEKMASLGELTAGIAHEIQNPLNFVNNFSELNTELIEELRKELAVGSKQSAEEIVSDIKSNSEKINHHGKRAADIVKGMLQHSRASSGEKEPIDINALCDEYLRLAYHGLRAKDKSFNATMKTDFDETVGTVTIIPQDMGRVILNLITNAFYAVNEKFKVESQKPGTSYEPTVTVSTTRSLSSGEGRDEVIIKVKDNGNGIPDSIKDKIFQPFFTTKPTGQGTGLGLSLAYDIVKVHDGELKVETKGEGTIFVIVIPVI